MDAHEKCYAFFSKQQAKIFGSFSASVPDGKGEKTNISYTELCTEEHHCIWPDRTLVWQGRKSDLQNLREDAAKRQRNAEMHALCREIHHQREQNA